MNIHHLVCSPGYQGFDPQKIGDILECFVPARNGNVQICVNPLLIGKLSTDTRESPLSSSSVGGYHPISFSDFVHHTSTYLKVFLGTFVVCIGFGWGFSSHISRFPTLEPGSSAGERQDVSLRVLTEPFCLFCASPESAGAWVIRQECINWCQLGQWPFKRMGKTWENHPCVPYRNHSKPWFPSYFGVFTREEPWWAALLPISTNVLSQSVVNYMLFVWRMFKLTCRIMGLDDTWYNQRL